MYARLSRAPLALALALLPAVSVTPALAASDAQLLQSYTGNYIGTGQMTGSSTGTVRCRLEVQSSGASAINYTGRCSSGGEGMALTGIITAKAGRIEAAMSGENGLSGTVRGVKRDGGVTFSSSQHVMLQHQARTVASTLAFTGGSIRVAFTMRDDKTGKTVTGSIPFTKLAR